MTNRVVGTPTRRVEGPDKVTGRQQYSADMEMDGLLWGKILRSPYPHARIVRVDASRARDVPGVHAVITGADYPRLIGRAMKDLPSWPTRRCGSSASVSPLWLLRQPPLRRKRSTSSRSNTRSWIPSSTCRKPSVPARPSSTTTRRCTPARSSTPSARSAQPLLLRPLVARRPCCRLRSSRPHL